jgi:hypothetical protein
MKKIVESYKQRLATEEGWVLKRGAQLRIALCYPNTYAIGMANLGFQAMYELFNNIPEVSCEARPATMPSLTVGLLTRLTSFANTSAPARLCFRSSHRVRFAISMSSLSRSLSKPTMKTWRACCK